MQISAIARESGLFVKQQLVTGLVIGVLSSYIYEHTLGKKEPVQIIVSTDEVIVTDGKDRVIVPRQVHDAAQLVATNPVFTRFVDRMLGSVVLDDRVTGFGIAPDIYATETTDLPLTLMLPRELLSIRDEQSDAEAKTRIVEEDCDLYIVKAIMERSTRKWEFKWHGINISAPIKDPGFYDDFARHDFTIAPGDEFQARMAIHQRRDDISGVFTNTKYEVLQVYRHVSRPRSVPLPLNK